MTAPIAPPVWVPTPLATTSPDPTSAAPTSPAPTQEDQPAAPPAGLADAKIIDHATTSDTVHGALGSTTTSVDSITHATTQVFVPKDGSPTVTTTTQAGGAQVGTSLDEKGNPTVQLGQVAQKGQTTAWGTAKANIGTLLTPAQKAEAQARRMTEDQIVANYALPALLANNPDVAKRPNLVRTGETLNIAAGTLTAIPDPVQLANADPARASYPPGFVGPVPPTPAKPVLPDFIGPVAAATPRGTEAWKQYGATMQPHYDNQIQTANEGVRQAQLKIAIAPTPEARDAAQRELEGYTAVLNKATADQGALAAETALAEAADKLAQATDPAQKTTLDNVYQQVRATTQAARTQQTAVTLDYNVYATADAAADTQAAAARDPANTDLQGKAADTSLAANQALKDQIGFIRTQMQEQRDTAQTAGNQATVTQLDETLVALDGELGGLDKAIAVDQANRNQAAATAAAKQDPGDTDLQRNSLVAAKHVVEAQKAQYVYIQDVLQGRIDAANAAGEQAKVDALTAQRTRIDSAVGKIDQALQAGDAKLADFDKAVAEHKSDHTWNSILNTGMGVLEIAGGVALGVVAGWTGIGAVAAAAIIAHGASTTFDGARDLATGKDQASPFSQGLQGLNLSEDVANRIDTGAGFVSSLVGGTALFKVALKSAQASVLVSQVPRGAAVTARGVSTAVGLPLGIDLAQSTGRYVVAGQENTPFSIQALQQAGLSETQANWLVMGGGTLLAGAAALGRGRLTQPAVVRSQPLAGGPELPSGAGPARPSAGAASSDGPITLELKDGEFVSSGKSFEGTEAAVGPDGVPLITNVRSNAAPARSPAQTSGGQPALPAAPVGGQPALSARSPANAGQPVFVSSHVFAGGALRGRQRPIGDLEVLDVPRSAAPALLAQEAGTVLAPGGRVRFDVQQRANATSLHAALEAQGFRDVQTAGAVSERWSVSATAPGRGDAVGGRLPVEPRGRDGGLPTAEETRPQAQGPIQSAWHDTNPVVDLQPLQGHPNAANAIYQVRAQLEWSPGYQKYLTQATEEMGLRGDAADQYAANALAARWTAEINAGDRVASIIYTQEGTEPIGGQPIAQRRMGIVSLHRENWQQSGPPDYVRSTEGLSEAQLKARGDMWLWSTYLSKGATGAGGTMRYGGGAVNNAAKTVLMRELESGLAQRGEPLASTYAIVDAGNAGSMKAFQGYAGAPPIAKYLVRDGSVKLVEKALFEAPLSDKSAVVDAILARGKDNSADILRADRRRRGASTLDDIDPHRPDPGSYAYASAKDEPRPLPGDRVRNPKYAPTADEIDATYRYLTPAARAEIKAAYAAEAEDLQGVTFREGAQSGLPESPNGTARPGWDPAPFRGPGGIPVAPPASLGPFQFFPGAQGPGARGLRAGNGYMDSPAELPVLDRSYLTGDEQVALYGGGAKFTAQGQGPDLRLTGSLRARVPVPADGWATGQTHSTLTAGISTKTGFRDIATAARAHRTNKRADKHGWSIAQRLADDLGAQQLATSRGFVQNLMWTPSRQAQPFLDALQARPSAQRQALIAELGAMDAKDARTLVRDFGRLSPAERQAALDAHLQGLPQSAAVAEPRVLSRAEKRELSEILVAPQANVSLRNAVGEQTSVSLRPDEYRRTPVYQFGGPITKDTIFTVFADKHLKGVMSEGLFAADRPGYEVRINGAPRVVGPAMDGSGQVVEVTVFSRMQAEPVTLQPGQRDIVGGSHDAKGGHVRLKAALPTDRIIEDYRLKMPQPLRNLLGLDIPTAGWERRTQVMLGDVPQAGDIVPARMFEQFDAAVSRAHYNVQFVVKDTPEAQAALADFQASRDPASVRRMVADGHVDPGNAQMFLPSHLPLYMPDARSQVGHHHHRTAIAGKVSGERFIDLTGRARTVPAMETANQWVVFGGQPNSILQHALGLGVESQLAEHVYQAKLKIHEQAKRAAPEWLGSRLRPPSPHHSTTPGDMMDAMFGGPGRPLADATTRYNIAVAGPSMLSRFSQLWGGGYSPEARVGYNIAAPALAPAVEATRLENSNPPGWFENTLVAEGKTGHAMPVPKGGTAQLKQWLDNLDALGDKELKAWTAGFRERFLQGDQPVIADGKWLRQAQAEEIDEALG